MKHNAENMSLRHFKKIGTLLAVGLICSSALVSCSKINTPNEIEKLSKFHHKLFPTTNALEEGKMSLYVDYSICNVLGQNSPVYNAIVPSLVATTRNYYSIKGDSINKESGQVFQLLRSINNVPHADLQTAVKKITDGNTEAVLLTDGEFYQPNIARAHVNDPYMADAFKTWLLKGHDIYIVIEPYKEPGNGGNTFNKKRFYMVFTDSRMTDNIWNRISNTANLERFPNVTTYHLSVDHPQLYTSGGNSSQVNPSLAANVKGFGNYEIQAWTVTWNQAVFPLIMNNTMDVKGTPLKHGDYICKGISVDRNAFGGYSINSVKAETYSINQEYSDFMSKVKMKPSDSIGGIMIDADDFKRHGNITLFFDQNFDEKSILTGSPYNYIRVDIKVSKLTDMFGRYADNFIFDSIDKPGMKNTSIAESIKQCLAYPEVKEKAENCLLYTYYIQSQEN